NVAQQDRNRHNQRYLQIPTLIKCGEQDDRKNLAECGAGKCYACCDLGILSAGQQGQRDEGDRDWINVTASGKFPNNQRVPRVNEDSLPGQSASSEQLSDSPNCYGFESNHDRF